MVVKKQKWSLAHERQRRLLREKRLRIPTPPDLALYEAQLDVPVMPPDLVRYEAQLSPLRGEQREEAVQPRQEEDSSSGSLTVTSKRDYTIPPRRYRVSRMVANRSRAVLLSRQHRSIVVEPKTNKPEEIDDVIFKIRDDYPLRAISICRGANRMEKARLLRRARSQTLSGTARVPTMNNSAVAVVEEEEEEGQEQEEVAASRRLNYHVIGSSNKSLSNKPFSEVLSNSPRSCVHTEANVDGNSIEVRLRPRRPTKDRILLSRAMDMAAEPMTSDVTECGDDDNDIKMDATEEKETCDQQLLDAPSDEDSDMIVEGPLPDFQPVTPTPMEWLRRQFGWL